MQLEKLGTPVSAETPHRRYAALHRAIESGIAAEATWSELVTVCVRLGHTDEALNALAHLKDPRLRRDAEHLLARRGLLDRPTNNDSVNEVEVGDGLKDQVMSALRILFEDHMPLTTVVTTMTFPLVVGLGGFLTASTSSFLFPAIAALPALCVAAIVGGLGRKILVDAAHGIDEPPRIPELRQLAQQSRRFLLDAVVLGTVFLGPAFALFFVGSPFVSAFIALILGAFLLPGAFMIRQLTEDWRALSPNYLFAAATRLRGDYATHAAICAAVAAPAVAAGVLTSGSQLYLQASVVGPLAVAPLFFAARLLGQLAHANRHDLRGIIPPVSISAPEAPPAREETPAPWTAGAERPVLRTTEPTPPRVTALPPARAKVAAVAAAATPAPVRHPEAKTVAGKAPPTRAPGAPTPYGRPTAMAAMAKPGQPAPANAQVGPTAPPREPHPMTTIAARGKRGNEAKQPVVAAASAPAAAKPATKVEVTTKSDLPPDFTQLPGFNVVKGAARVLSGAAAKAGKRRS